MISAYFYQPYIQNHNQISPALTHIPKSQHGRCFLLLLGIFCAGISCISRHKPFDSHGKGIILVHLFQSPYCLAPMNSIMGTLMTVLAESDAQIWLILPNMVRCAWRWMIAYAAWQRLHRFDVFAFTLCV